MSIETIFYMSMILFLISSLGLLISYDAVSFFISRQIMIAAAVINFLNFSLRISPEDFRARMLLVVGLLTLYLLEFTLLFYIYSNTDSLQRKSVSEGYRLFSLKKSYWWGEDRF